MHRSLKPALLSLLLASAAISGADLWPADMQHLWQADMQHLWQADIQIRTLEVTKTKTSLTARVVVFSENDDEARDSRLLIFLPVGVGIERMALGCSASPSPAMVPSLRALVQCDLGAIPVRGLREVTVSTTIPPDGLAKRFGVFAYSGTPDPKPANNYAERSIP